MINTQPYKIAVALSILLAAPLSAVELLTDGGFEFAAAIPGWDLQESIYDQVTMLPRNFGDVNSAEQSPFGAPISGDLTLWLRAFVGGAAPDPDAVTNASLSQTVPAAAGTEYSFSGYSKWEINYSGGFNTLNNGPLGMVPSPTDTTMELAFLDGGGGVLDSTTLDLRTEQNNFGNWVEHILTGTAPTGTASARVTAGATAMLWNGGGQESAFYDNFSLVNVADPETELLANPDMEDELPPFDPAAYTVMEVPGGNIPGDPTVSTADFASRDESGGQLGLWFRSFTGDEMQPADAIVSQTVPGMAGAEYTFSAWSNFQDNYSGGDPAFDTQTLIELAFLDAGGMEIETPRTLDLVNDGQTNGAGWQQHMIVETAPAGTVSVRVSGAGLGMETNPLGGAQSAFLDDFSLDGPAMSFLAGDYDGSGLVGAGDLGLVLQFWGQDGSPPPPGWVNDLPEGIISSGELSVVLSGWGNTAVFAVPEPGTATLSLVVAVVIACRRSDP